MQNDEALRSCDNWFWVNAAGQQDGPHTSDQVIASLTSGSISYTTNVWCTHLPAWIPATDVPFLAAHIQAPAKTSPPAAAAAAAPAEAPSPAVDAAEAADSAHADKVSPGGLKIPATESGSSAQRAHDNPTTSTSQTPSPHPALRQGAPPPATRPRPSSSGSSMTTGNARVDQALEVMQSELEALSHRRVPLCFPVLDLNRFVAELESTAFMGLSEEYIISQMYLETVKARQALQNPARQHANKQLADSFRNECVQVKELLNKLENDVNSITNMLEKTLAEEGSSAQTFDVARHEVDQVRAMVHEELAFCRRRVEKHEYLLSCPSMFFFYQTMVLATMQMLVGTKFIIGTIGPSKDRFKARMAKETKLSVLVKKGIEVLGGHYPMPRFKKATVAAELLERNILTLHSKHLMIKAFIDHCSEFARFAAGVQETVDCVAQTLAFRFEEQIRQLVPNSAHDLAEYAFRAMCIMLKRESAGEHRSLPAFLVASVQDESVMSSKTSRTVLGVKKQKLETIRGTSVDTWNAIGIFRKSGVRLTEANGRMRYFEGGVFKGAPEKYGYRVGSERECLALSMTETQTRKRPDMELSGGGGGDSGGIHRGNVHNLQNLGGSFSHHIANAGDSQLKREASFSMSMSKDSYMESPHNTVPTKVVAAQSTATQSQAALSPLSLGCNNSFGASYGASMHGGDADWKCKVDERLSKLEASCNELRLENKQLRNHMQNLQGMLARNGLQS